MAIALQKNNNQYLNIMTESIRLWELSNEIQQLETAIALIVDNETLSEEDKEIKLEETYELPRRIDGRGSSFDNFSDNPEKYISVHHRQKIDEAVREYLAA